MRKEQKFLWAAAFVTASLVGCRDGSEPKTTPLPIPDTHNKTNTEDMPNPQTESVPAYPAIIYETSPTQPTYPSSPLTNREIGETETQVEFASVKLPTKQTGDAFSVPDTFPNGVIKLEPFILEAAIEHGIDPELVASVIATESHGTLTNSPDNAQGVMQVMPEHFDDGEDPNDLQTNINRGVELLSGQLSATNGNIEAALAGYNAGPAARNWIMGPEEEYDERKQRFIEIITQYLVDSRGYELDRAIDEATHKAWEVEVFIERVTYWQNQFGD